MNENVINQIGGIVFGVMLLIAFVFTLRFSIKIYQKIKEIKTEIVGIHKIWRDFINHLRDKYVR